MVNDPRLKMLPTKRRARLDEETLDRLIAGDIPASEALGLQQEDMSRLRAALCQLLDSGHVEDAKNLAEFLLSIGDDTPTLLVLVAQIAAGEGRNADAQNLVRDSIEVAEASGMSADFVSAAHAWLEVLKKETAT